MSEYLIQGETLSGIADAIRVKTGKSDPIQANSMASEIQAIPSGGGSEQLDSLLSNTLLVLNSNTTTIANTALDNLTSLEEINLPFVISIGANGIYGCTNLKRMCAPVLETIDNYAFSRCSSLLELNLPSIRTIGLYSFSSCTSLKNVDIGTKITKIYNSFLNCAALDTFIVRTEEPPTLNSEAFSGTSIANGVGYIYVPPMSLDAYKQATNWTVYAEQIRAIEDYPEITGGAL